MTVSIAPSKNTLLALGRDQAGLKMSFTVVKKLALRPRVGLSLTYAPGAAYATFGRLDAGSDGSGVVAVDGERDIRLNYVLSLAGEVGPLGDEWFLGPEAVLSPADGIRALGVGVGLRWKILRLSGGVQWMKRTSLVGQSVDLALDPGVALQTREVWVPEGYLGFALFGWEPFKP